MDNKLGSIICRLRKEKGLTQKDLADVLNVSDKAISRWETGNSFPDLDMIFRISKFFNVTFNDLLQARIEGNDTEDHFVKEIIAEVTEIKRNNSKKIKIAVLIILLLTVIFTIVIIFTSSYNRFKVYRIVIENSDFVTNYGVYVETRIKDSMYLGNIKIKNVEIKETDIVSVDVYILDDNKEEVIFNNYSLNNLYFTNNQSYIEINDLSDYFDKLYIRVTIIDKDKVQTYESKLNFVADFTNNKIFYTDEFEKNLSNNETLDLNKDEIVKKLLENGFEKSDYNVFFKRTKSFVVNYHVDSNTISYFYEKNNLSYRYIYYLFFDRLEVSVFDENNTEIENYVYDVDNDKVINCITGSCNNYEEAMGLLNKNFLSLIN